MLIPSPCGQLVPADPSLAGAQALPGLPSFKPAVPAHPTPQRPASTSPAKLQSRRDRSFPLTEPGCRSRTRYPLINWLPAHRAAPLCSLNLQTLSRAPDWAFAIPRGSPSPACTWRLPHPLPLRGSLAGRRSLNPATSRPIAPEVNPSSNRGPGDSSSPCPRVLTAHPHLRAWRSPSGPRGSAGAHAGSPHPEKLVGQGHPTGLEEGVVSRGCRHVAAAEPGVEGEPARWWPWPGSGRTARRSDRSGLARGHCGSGRGSGLLSACVRARVGVGMRLSA